MGSFCQRRRQIRLAPVLAGPQQFLDGEVLSNIPWLDDLVFSLI